MKKKRINLSDLSAVKKLLRQSKLHTVCESALCPNISECFCNRTATFLILGNICTRNCTFCAIEKGTPQWFDLNEPMRVAEAVSTLGLKYAVVTSVTRDDLSDGGAGIFSKTIESIRTLNAQTKVEVLIPDFNGNEGSYEILFKSKPDVLNHNIETISRLYPTVRPMAIYERSLALLAKAKEQGLTTKSGIMLGLGESEIELYEAMNDLLEAGCDLLTIGQYMQPSKNHHPVVKVISNEAFEMYKEKAISMGFKDCASSQFVRSSYNAHKLSA